MIIGGNGIDTIRIGAMRTDVHIEQVADSTLSSVRVYSLADKSGDTV